MATAASDARCVQWQHTRTAHAHASAVVLYPCTASHAPSSRRAVRSAPGLGTCGAHGGQCARSARPQACVARAVRAQRALGLRASCPAPQARAVRRRPLPRHSAPPATPPPLGGGDIVNTARDSFHPRWQPTSAFALKTLKVGIAEIPSSDPISRTSSVLNLANTHDLARERGEAGVLGGASEAPGLHCGARAAGDPPPRSPPCCRAQARGRLEPYCFWKHFRFKSWCKNKTSSYIYFV